MNNTKTKAMLTMISRFFRLAVILLFAASVSSSVVAHSDNNNNNNSNNKWLMFRVGKDGHADLVAAKFVASSPSTCASDEHLKKLRRGDLVVTYGVHNSDSDDDDDDAVVMMCRVAVRNPRVKYHDAAHPTHGESHFHGHRKLLDESHFAIVVPRSVSSIDSVAEVVVVAASTSRSNNREKTMRRSTTSQQRLEVSQAHFRAAETLAASAIDTSQIHVQTLQVVGPVASQKNMVFLASGYTATQQSNFDDDVQSLVNFLQSSSTTLSSMPYHRYFSVFNFFSVFHPSAQSGASHPAPAGSGAVADNILDCSYGHDSARILACNRARVLLVASHAPPDAGNAIIIVLVNDNVFGGSAGGGVCEIYSGSKMKTVFIHEIGHAFAELSDEYDYFVSEAEDIDLINCHYSRTRNVPWQNKIDAGVLGTPSRVCTYENYYKPTSGLCLMHSDQFSLCTVCSEATVRTVYGQNSFISGGDGVNLAAPRFPSEHDTVVVRDNETVMLWANDKFSSHSDTSGAFTVEWFLPNGSLLASGISNVGVANASLNETVGGGPTWHHDGVGNYTMHVEITDNTNIFLSATRASLQVNKSSLKSLKQRHPYRIRIIAADDTSVACTWRNDTHGGMYCGSCEPGYEAECALQVTTNPLTAVADIREQLPEVQGWLIGLGVGFVALGAIAFYFAFKTMEEYAEENVGEIMPLTDTLEVLRWALMIFTIFQMLTCTFVIIYSAYMFIVVGIFGRSFILGICVVACFVWFFSFFGFSGAYFNNRKVVFSTFAISIFFLMMTLIFTGILLYTANNLGEEDVFLQLREYWRDAVKSDPEAACRMERTLYCSGFADSCVTAVSATQDCPVNCENTNRIAFPCWPKVEPFVDEHFRRASIGGILLIVCLVLVLLLSLLFGCGMKINKSRVTRQRYHRQEHGEATLTEGEMQQLKKEFDKVDKESKGEITRDEFAKFYNKTMGMKLDKEELREYFDSLDTEGTGTLSFKNFVQIYMPPSEEEKQAEEENKKVDFGRSFSGYPDPNLMALGHGFNGESDEDGLSDSGVAVHFLSAVNSRRASLRMPTSNRDSADVSMTNFDDLGLAASGVAATDVLPAGAAAEQQQQHHRGGRRTSQVTLHLPPSAASAGGGGGGGRSLDQSMNESEVEEISQAKDDDDSVVDDMVDSFYPQRRRSSTLGSPVKQESTALFSPPANEDGADDAPPPPSSGVRRASAAVSAADGITTPQAQPDGDDDNKGNDDDEDDDVAPRGDDADPEVQPAQQEENRDHDEEDDEEVVIDVDQSEGEGGK